MSRHRVKTIDFEDEDYEEYYDEEEEGGGEGDAELTEEDREQLRLGTIEVQSLLQALQQDDNAAGSLANITEKEIREALWHYYYDVDKAVGYLKNKHAPQQPKKSAKQSKQPAPSKSKTPGTENVSGFPLPPCFPRQCTGRFSTADFFRDTPWLAVPPHRKAEILIEPLYPRLGLLGGAPEASGKVSKLAALAAARKKREAEKNAANSPPGSEEKKSDSSLSQKTATLSLQDRLAGAGERRAPDTRDAKLKLGRRGRIKSESSPEKQVSLETPPKEEPSDKPEEKSELQEIPATTASTEELSSQENLRAPPSTFASVMVGDNYPHAARAPSYLSSGVNVMELFGQNVAEAFNFAGPSPDDVALNARNPAKGNKSKQAAGKSSSDKKSRGDVADGVKQLSVEEPVKVKSKNLDVLAEFQKTKRKNAANFVVIGHVDAGKSTLMGRLLYDLKAIDQRTLEKYRREADTIGKSSFALAWVLDQDSEERSRGVTIDIATNQFETEKTNFTILDAPGHRDFVPNMIAGASQADFAMLVIDSGTGNFESGLKGQTKEHALLVRSMGVQKLVVAVNKMDAAKWSKDRFQEIEQQISSFLTTAGFQPKNISFVPCSGLHGDNVTRRTEDPAASWYTGKTLVEELESSEQFSFSVDKPLRMTIGDIFRGGVQNPLSISGRLDSGSLQVGEQLVTMPSGEKATIKGIEVDYEPSDWAVAGQNVILHLTDIDAIHLRTGDVLCSATSPIQNVSTFTVKVLAFDHLTPMQIEVHRGRLHVPGRIAKIVATLDKSSGAPVRKKPKIVAPGSVARVVVEMERAVPLEAPGRVVLRWSGETMAAGLLE